MHNYLDDARFGAWFAGLCPWPWWCCGSGAYHDDRVDCFGNSTFEFLVTVMVMSA